jgi:hypothetical protein
MKGASLDDERGANKSLGFSRENKNKIELRFKNLRTASSHSLR